ncbi:Ger(x)C family spore germination protein [Paenibacillus soyae]|uniref:Ger(X)C family spore germination protein n=1 Tax=Paenibacillus soyae TaxID=2969249 RepID=A0A9X2MSQ5_9BACL|nr:Ger(x)C family spore germination protein [Paenibacillus soyae]MCR2807448.1 Ger(x)C family spore germination protein [Paenibacillus soyae]
MSRLANRLRGAVAAAISLLLVLPLAGCWSTTEINDLAIITVLGIDQNEHGEFQVSALVIRPSNISQGGLGSGFSGGGDNPSYVVAEAVGDTMFQAMQKLSSTLSKRMYWSHLQAIVLGRKAADEHSVTILDILMREQQFRKNIDVLVTKGKAVDIVKTKPHLEGSLGAEIHGIIKYSKHTATTIVQDISHFASSISSSGIDHITGEISSTADRGSSISEDGTKTPSLNITGSAAFKEGRLAGFLDRVETRGVLWIVGQVKTGSTKMSCPEGNGNGISLEITNARSSRIPKKTADGISMKVVVDIEAEIREIACDGFELNPDRMDQLNEQLENTIMDEMNHALKKAKEEWQSDVFQFGTTIYKKYPKEWKQLRASWREGEFRRMKVELEVRAQIKRAGLIHDSIRVDERR